MLHPMEWETRNMTRIFRHFVGLGVFILHFHATEVNFKMTKGNALMGEYFGIRRSISRYLLDFSIGSQRVCFLP